MKENAPVATPLSRPTRSPLSPLPQARGERGERGRKERRGVSPRWTDHETEVIIGRLLQIGVLLAALVVGVGGILYLWKGAAQIPHHSIFHGEPAELRTVGGIFQEALRGNPRGIIEAGLLILIATPVARVLFSIWAFARERDSLYVGITLFVLGVLLYSLFQG